MRTAIGACLSVSAVMTWAMIWGPTNEVSTANISDAGVGTQASSTPDTNPVVRVPKLIGNNPVVSITRGVNADTVRFYERETGKSFEASLRTGTLATLSDKKLDGFMRTFWAPSKTEVVSVFQEGGGLRYRSYAYATGRTADIGSALTSLAYAPSGRSIVTVSAQDTTSTLAIAKPDGTEARTLLNTRAQDVAVQWPQENMISLFSRRPDGSGNDMSLVGTDGALSSLISNKENLEYAWSPDGQELLFSYFTAGQGIQLWLLDASSHTMQSLGVATSAAKCAWGSAGLIVCGVPSSSSLTRDVTADKSATLDDIVSIDLTSGTQSISYTGTKNALIGVGESLISSSGTYFVFTNIFDHRLYRLEI